MQVSEPFTLVKTIDSFLIPSEVGLSTNEVLKSQYCKLHSLTLDQILQIHLLIARLFHS